MFNPNKKNALGLKQKNNTPLLPSNSKGEQNRLRIDDNDLRIQSRLYPERIE